MSMSVWMTMADAITDVLMKMAGNVLVFFTCIILYYYTPEQRRKLTNCPKRNTLNGIIDIS